MKQAEIKSPKRAMAEIVDFMGENMKPNINKLRFVRSTFWDVDEEEFFDAYDHKELMAGVVTILEEAIEAYDKLYALVSDHHRQIGMNEELEFFRLFDDILSDEDGKDRLKARLLDPEFIGPAHLFAREYHGVLRNRFVMKRERLDQLFKEIKAKYFETVSGGLENVPETEEMEESQ